MVDPTAVSFKQRHRPYSDIDPVALPSDNNSNNNNNNNNKPSLGNSQSVHSEKSQGNKLHHRAHHRLNGLKSQSAWSLYLGFLFSLIVLAHHLHYRLPDPVVDNGHGIDPRTGLRNRFSEANVRKVVKDLSEGIGYRIVGTEQDLETQVYLQRNIKDLKDQAQRMALRPEGGHLLPKFEVWTQVADGSHQFDFMSKGGCHVRRALLATSLALSLSSLFCFACAVETGLDCGCECVSPSEPEAGLVQRSFISCNTV
jgi:hypothetical protein